MTVKNLTAIAKVEVVFVNGNRIAFEDAAGLDLGKVRTAASVLKEEIRSVTPEKAAQAA